MENRHKETLGIVLNALCIPPALLVGLMGLAGFAMAGQIHGVHKLPVILICCASISNPIWFIAGLTMAQNNDKKWFRFWAAGVLIIIVIFYVMGSGKFTF